MSSRPLTIGALARRLNVSTSMLRFYEREGLLAPERRSASGYRLYPASAEKTLLFIRRAQRLGFSLNDIKLLQHGGSNKGRDDVMNIAEQRFLDIERRLTEMLVLRHELEFFLEDLTERVGRAAGGPTGRLYRELLNQVCGHEARHKAPSSLARLIKRLGCALATAERDKVFATLRGRHIHIWREDDGYSILVASRDPQVEKALRQLAASEANCEVHVEPRVSEADEGFLFQVRGPNSFLFAQLFLALETAET
ncbi:MAG: MerR family DNA-binding transcriptional regulator [Gammaproteobacteria bacterium]|nr:MAG: MerR family DNA-binding transcriptional regulator [Gammaproteobacteria bacterium]